MDSTGCKEYRQAQLHINTLYQLFIHYGALRVIAVDKPFHSLPMTPLRSLEIPMRNHKATQRPCAGSFLTSGLTNSTVPTQNSHFLEEMDSPWFGWLQPWTIRIFHSFWYGQWKEKHQTYPGTGVWRACSLERWALSLYFYRRIWPSINLFSQGKQTMEQRWLNIVIHRSYTTFHLLAI